MKLVLVLLWTIIKSVITVQSKLRLKKIKQNLTANDQVNLLRSRKLICALLVEREIFGDNEELDDAINALIFRHIYPSYAEDKPLPPCVDKKRTIESFGSEIKQNFRFEVDEIRLLIKELEIPEQVTFDN